MGQCQVAPRAEMRPPGPRTKTAVLSRELRLGLLVFQILTLAGAAFVGFLPAPPAFAWGPRGHRACGQAR